MLDSSGSIRENRFELMKLMVIEIVQNLEIKMDKTRVGLLYFSRAARLQFDLLAYTVRQV